MNTVTLVGRLESDPISRMVGNQPVVRMRVAIEERSARTLTVVDIDVWGRQGSVVAHYLARGRLVAVVGRLASSLWRDGVSNRRQHVFVVAHAVDFLDKPDRSRAVAS